MKFELQENYFKTEIAGVELSGNPTLIEIEISKAHKELIAFSDKISAGDAEYDEIGGVIGTALNHVDKAFGCGTCEKIFRDFGDRLVSFHDCLDVVVFLIAALNNFESEKEQLYKAFYSPEV